MLPLVERTRTYTHNKDTRTLAWLHPNNPSCTCGTEQDCKSKELSRKGFQKEVSFLVGLRGEVLAYAWLSRGRGFQMKELICPHAKTHAKAERGSHCSISKQCP